LNKVHFDSIEDEGDDLNLEIDSITEIVPSQDRIDKLLNKALAESVQSVQDKSPTRVAWWRRIPQHNGGRNLQKEIAQIFDKASLDLKAALEDIRIEQQEFARQSARKSIAKTRGSLEERSSSHESSRRLNGENDRQG
jgi:exonuclease VII large subunit